MELATKILFLAAVGATVVYAERIMRSLAKSAKI